METVTASTHVNAPPPVVFGLLNTPMESVRAGQSQSFSNVTALPNGGHEYDYTFRMVGVPLTGRVRTTTHDPPHRLTLSYAGDIDGEVSFALAGDGGTTLTATAEYDMPNPVLEAVAGPVVRRYNQREIGGFVESIRDRVEAQYDPDANPTGDGLEHAAWTPEPAPGDA